MKDFFPVRRLLLFLCQKLMFARKPRKASPANSRKNNFEESLKSSKILAGDKNGV